MSMLSIDLSSYVNLNEIPTVPEGLFTKKISVSYDEESQEKTLHVLIAPAAAVEFQHFQNKILEKINSFFGYKAIHYIKIHQKFSSKNIHKKQIQNKHFEKNLLNKKRNKINDTSQKINDKELENSLFNLGLSIEQNDKK